MHRFYMDRPVATQQESVTASTTLQRLNLGVGDTGVVGRTVSVVDEHQVVVGEGIIGWN
jgi:hypothetical protein